MIEHIEDPSEYTCPKCDAEPAKLCREGDRKQIILTPSKYHQERKDIAAHLSELKDEVEIRLNLKLTNDKFIEGLIWKACLDDVEGYQEMLPNDFAELLRDGIEPKTIEEVVDFAYSVKDEVKDVIDDIVDHFKRLK